MTEISVGLSGGRAVSLTAAGHSGFEEAGSDIVCAGISALFQALVYGLETVLKAGAAEYSFSREETRMSVNWSKCRMHEADVLAETMIGSMKAIARIYPEHVRIVEVRIDDLEL